MKLNLCQSNYQGTVSVNFEQSVCSNQLYEVGTVREHDLLQSCIILAWHTLQITDPDLWAETKEAEAESVEERVEPWETGPGVPAEAGPEEAMPREAAESREPGLTLEGGVNEISRLRVSKYG